MTDGTASGFVPVTFASFVGSTAILIWLAGRLGLPGLGDSGCSGCSSPYRSSSK